MRTLEGVSTRQRKENGSSQVVHWADVASEPGKPDPVCPAISRDPTEKISHNRFGSDSRVMTDKGQKEKINGVGERD